MSKKVRFYVMHNRKTGDVEFVESGYRLRMRDMMLRGYENIGSGECKDVSELNRGICSNIRGMYEYQKRQNDELKVQLERALQKLKEVHRISGIGNTEPRNEHVPFDGKQYRSFDSLSLRERIEVVNTPHPPQVVLLLLKEKAGSDEDAIEKLGLKLPLKFASFNFHCMPARWTMDEETEIAFKKFWEEVN